MNSGPSELDPKGLGWEIPGWGVALAERGRTPVTRLIPQGQEGVAAPAEGETGKT